MVLFTNSLPFSWGIPVYKRYQYMAMARNDQLPKRMMRLTFDQMCGHKLVPYDFTAIGKECSHCCDTCPTNPGYPSVLRSNISQPFLIISVNLFHGLQDNFLEATSDGLIWKKWTRRPEVRCGSLWPIQSVIYNQSISIINLYYLFMYIRSTY